MKPHRQNKAVFLDRDGTIIYDRPGHYLSRPQDLRMYKDTARALAKLKRGGYRLFLVTNQSGIGRGYFPVETVEKIHARLQKLLRAQGAQLDEIIYCPHHPDAKCGCRKPLPFMGDKLIRKYGISPELSFIIGDKKSDMQFGKNLGLNTVFVKTGHGNSQLEKYADAIPADHTASGIMQAANWILKNEIQD
jgi:D-glycero-D-manno-heptose 1,7-bisphosphate phosphatase